MFLRLRLYLITLAIIVSAQFLSGCVTQPSSSDQSSSEQQSHDTSHSTLEHPMKVSTEKEFLLQMIPHHQEAVDTSVLLLSQTQDPELLTFAQAVSETQQSEIITMKEWLKQWYSEEYAGQVPYRAMMGDLTTLNGPELELAYIEGMILHHTGAIDMAEQVLTLSPRNEVATFANRIIETQEAEVTQLKKWLSALST